MLRSVLKQETGHRFITRFRRIVWSMFFLIPVLTFLFTSSSSILSAQSWDFASEQENQHVPAWPAACIFQDYGHTMHHGFSSQHSAADIDQALNAIEDTLRHL